MTTRIKIVIPTLNGGAQLKACLWSLGEYYCDALVIDSGSTDGSQQFLDSSTVKSKVIETDLFNHGWTRETSRKELHCDIIVFLTQDVELRHPDHLLRLVQPILENRAEVSYGRQVPKTDAGFFERFPREYNYPSESHVRSVADIDKYGAYTFFCSDSFAAYSQKALDEVGGFEATLTHEDYFTVAKILRNGGRIAYVAEAEVIHSHRYSLMQEFQRYFDAGYVRAVNPWVTELVGQAENHGSRFFKTMLKVLCRKKPHLIPYAILQTSMKWLGFRLGFLCFKSPTWVKKFFSGQSYYFDSKYYIPGKN